MTNSQLYDAVKKKYGSEMAEDRRRAKAFRNCDMSERISFWWNKIQKELNLQTVKDVDNLFDILDEYFS